MNLNFNRLNTGQVNYSNSRKVGFGYNSIQKPVDLSNPESKPQLPPTTADRLDQLEKTVKEQSNLNWALVNIIEILKEKNQEVVKSLMMLGNKCPAQADSIKNLENQDSADEVAAHRAEQFATSVSELTGQI